MDNIIIVKGNPLFFPKGNENGDYYEPLWIAKFGKYFEHEKTVNEAKEKLNDTIRTR